MTPTAPGEYYFVGTVIVRHSLAPYNTTTVHIDKPRRFWLIQTEYGVIPFEPDSTPLHAYALATFDGEWECLRKWPKEAK